MMHGPINIRFTFSLVFMFSFSTHVSQAYVTTGLTNVLYIRSLEFLVNSLLLNRSWFAYKLCFLGVVRRQRVKAPAKFLEGEKIVRWSDKLGL